MDFIVAGKREKPDAGGAGLCTKLVFTILFLSFALTTTLFMMDYKEGQLAQVASTLPPEVQQLAKKADVAVAALAKNIKVIAAQALIKAEELSKKVPIGGDRTLADVVFNSGEKVGIVYFNFYQVTKLSICRKLKRLLQRLQG